MTEAQQQQQRYRVIEHLASGGMAEVFLAESTGIEGFRKRVAIKRVLPNLSQKKRFIQMFLDEARLSAQLSHSNVAQVFDIGVGDKLYFIVMEYVDGADLKAVIEFMKNSSRAFPVEAACFIAAKICEGLSYAHELAGPDGQPLRIVHRDMSPPNVLITKYGEVKIVDFGLAKATSQLEKSEPGIIKGKYSYLSPEAAQGNDVDQRTDIFAVGIILWEMLAGRRLFLGENDFATVKMVQNAQIPPIRTVNAHVPQELEPILSRALARDPMARYASARDLGRDLTKFLFGFGRPVSSYDVAELVRGAMALRKRSQPDKASVIDKLIEEALLEFTSLLDDKGSKAAPAKAEPMAAGGFEDIGKWVDELNVGGPVSTPSGPDVVRSALPSGAFVEGNLAALEDETGKHRAVNAGAAAAAAAPKGEVKRPLSVPPSPQVAAFASKSGESRSASAAASASTKMEKAQEAAPARSGGVVKALLVLVLLAILFAGAWFGGLIPH